MSQGFHGAQNAGDFLGLDTEFTGSQEADAVGMHASLDLVQPPSAGSMLQPEPMAGEVAGEVTGHAADIGGAREGAFSEAPSAFEFGEDLGTEQGAFPEGPRTSVRVPRLVGAFLLAALLGAGALFGPRLYSRYFGVPAVEVAQRAAPTRTPSPAQPADSTTTPGLPEADSNVEQVVGADSAPSQDGQAATASTTSKAASATQAPTATNGGEPRVGTRAPLDTPPVAPSPVPPSASSNASAPRLASFPDLEGSSYEWASEDQLELIWRGDVVPMEAVVAPAKTLMPRVGNVRVFMNTGDVFEGRLYAVGQNRVWLDSQPGRIGLDGDRLQKIEVLPPEPEGGATLDDLNIAGTTRVRVRVPGGSIFGRVLKVEGEEVILVPDGGGRVRVKAQDVVELGSGRAIVVGR